ncbi:T9SS type A sorting domain-containing protein [Polaribacter sp.]|nr:T9SS type A sorting domain-containing protein [Polaribacter sp.]MDC1237587.1 T9SS type A sorting domain-containing protein [Polaribacter sp.]
MKKLTLLLCFVSFLTKAQNITVASGKSFTIEKTGAVTMSGNFSNSGTFTLNSDSDEFSSIIIGGTVAGNISYNRYVNSVGTNEWDLIGSPVDGQSISAFASANVSTLATNGATKAIGYYNNADNTWTNYTTSTIGGAGNFPLGKGFQMGTIANGTGILSFTGSPAATNKTQAIINNDAANSGAGTRWNLVANPFPSYIQGNTNADSSNNFLTINSDKLHDSYEAIYGYDADGTGYTIYNNSSGALLLAPGQGFMIASDNTNSDNISFTTDMRTIVGGDDFITSSRAMQDSYELILKLYQGDTEIDNTRFYFKEGLNLGLDPGYDAGHFNQSASLMSRLVDEDKGVGFAVNAMGLESINDVVIPLVVNRESGNGFKISIHTNDIYEGTNVYLEDNQQGTVTLLNEQDFELTPQDNLSGAGRFFVHLTSASLSIEDDIETHLLNVYKSDINNFITIEGTANQSNQINLRLYNILGKEVVSKTLENNINTQTISTQGLATGIYVIKLKSGNTVLTKKLIIN